MPAAPLPTIPLVAVDANSSIIIVAQDADDDDDDADDSSDEQQDDDEATIPELAAADAAKTVDAVESNADDIVDVNVLVIFAVN